MCFYIYFCDFHRLEGEGDCQEDPEDPNFEGEQEEDFVEGKSYLSSIILNPWFINTAYLEPDLNIYIAFLFKKNGV